MKSWLTGILIAAVLAAAAAAAALAWYDGERIRARLETTLADEYGVTLRIGRLTRSYEFRPVVRIEDLAVSNARRSDETLIALERARFRIRLTSLLLGPITLDDLAVSGVRIAVPVDREGVRYWEPVVDAISSFLHRFDFSLHGFEIADLTLDRRHVERGSELLVSARHIAGTMPRLAALELEAGGVDANLETTLPLPQEGTARLDAVVLSRTDGDLPMSLTARGRIGEKALAIDARGGNLLDGDALERDPVEGTIEVGGRTARVSGSMSRDDDLHVDVAVRVAMPPDDSGHPVHGSMRVSDPGSGWRFSNIHVERGAGTLDGDVSVTHRGERRHVAVEFGLDGVRHPHDAGDGDAPEDEARDSREDLYAGLLDFIERFDARIAIDVDDSSLYGTPLDGLRTLATINRGTFEFRVDDGRLLGGDVEGSLTVVRDAGTAALTLRASLRQADLASLLEKLPAMDGSAGAFDGDLDLAARGRETAGVLSSVGGEFSLYLPDGRMPDELARWMAGDVFAAMFADLEGTTTPVDCAVIEFDVARGEATSRRMVLDTGSFTLVGSGRIDLPEGRLAIELAPWSKRFRLLSMRLPVSIEGSFDDLRFDPDASEAVASLLTPIDTGRGADVACSAPEAQLAAR